MRCVRLSWRINYDFTLRWSVLPEKKGTSNTECERVKNMEGCTYRKGGYKIEGEGRRRERVCQRETGQERQGTDEYGPAAANRSIPLITQLSQANDMNAI